MVIKCPFLIMLESSMPGDEVPGDKMSADQMFWWPSIWWWKVREPVPFGPLIYHHQIIYPTIQTGSTLPKSVADVVPEDVKMVTWSLALWILCTDSPRHRHRLRCPSLDVGCSNNTCDDAALSRRCVVLQETLSWATTQVTCCKSLKLSAVLQEWNKRRTNPRT